MVSLSNHEGLAPALVRRFMVRQAHHEALFRIFSQTPTERVGNVERAVTELSNRFDWMVGRVERTGRRLEQLET